MEEISVNNYKPSCAGDERPWTLAYECRPAMDALIVALRPFLGAGEFIVYRDTWRWKRDDGCLEIGHRGSVISNAYEGFAMEEAAELTDAEIIWNFGHVGVLRKIGTRSPAVTSPDAKEDRRG